MSYPSLSHFIAALESANELTRITEFVSPNLEITEVADRMVKNGGKALLFENNGTEFPLLINAMASDRRMCMALGVDELADIETNLSGLLAELTGPRKGFFEKLRLLPTLKSVASWFPTHKKGRGACQEVVMEHPDLTLLPVLTCWPYDGGPFITLPGVHTKDPVSGSKNLGMYRMQVFGPQLTGMHWHMHKGSANHFRAYKELGKRMPVSVTLGGDPAYTYAATAPLPENLDEYLLAGFLRRRRVELVRCLTNELEVPSDVDFVIEGYVDPSEDLILEGPFGDHTGFYSLADFFPRFHVTCITHRKNAIYPATIVGIPPQEDGWIGKATERIFLTPIKMTVAPEIADMHMPVEGVFHNITLVSIHKQFPGQALKIMSSLWGAGQMMFNKVMSVFDGDISLTDYHAIARAISIHCDPVTDIHFMRGPVDILDHASSNYAFGSKIGFDATRKLIQEMGVYNPGTISQVIDSESNMEHKSGDLLQPEKLPQVLPDVKSVRADLPDQGISLLMISIAKNRNDQVRVTASVVAGQNWARGIKFVLFTDEFVDLNNISQVVWIVANNIDPVRDCFYIDRKPGVKFPVLFIDGTCKSSELDGFTRDWPNVIVMDDEVIKTVDEKWPLLGLGPFISSPSLVFRHMVVNPGAVSSKI